MKRIVAAIALCLLATSALAAGTIGLSVKGGKTISVKSDPATEYIEVKTDNTTYRIYPCGQLEKLVWKELNPNEDVRTATGIPMGTWHNTVVTPAITTINGNIAY